MEDVQVRDEPKQSRYVIELHGEPIGRLDYRLGDGSIAMTHAEIQPAYENRGYGTELVRAAVDDAESRSLRIVPICPFVVAYMRRRDRA